MLSEDLLKQRLDLIVTELQAISKDVKSTWEVVSVLEKALPSSDAVGSKEPLSPKLRHSKRNVSKSATIVPVHALSHQGTFRTSVSSSTPLQRLTSSATESIANGANHSFLPVGWPATVEMRDGLDAILLDDGNTEDPTFVQDVLSRRQASSSHGQAAILLENDEKSECQSAFFHIQDPSSKFIVGFDLLSLLPLTYDLMIMPYALAWDVELVGASLTLSVFAALYWTAAILVRFRTGFYDKGELKMTQRAITSWYLRNGFVIDLGMCVIDWFVLAGSDAETLQDFKVLRIVKVLRLVKIVELVDRMLDTFDRNSKLLIRMLQVVWATLIFAHIMSCTWFSVGKSQNSDTGRRWVDGTFTTPDNIDIDAGEVAKYDKVGQAFEYLTSMHWTLAQITLGAISIEPSSSVERVFCIGLLLVGMMFSATIVSLISSSAMEYVSIHQEKQETVRVLRLFLDQCQVESSLGLRVRKQLEQRLAARSNYLSEKDVPAISILSAQLQGELLQAVREPHLLSHPLLNMWKKFDATALKHLCACAVKLTSFTPRDCIFLPAAEANACFYMVKGVSNYTQNEETSYERQESSIAVKAGTWVSEMTLWSHWAHVGKLEAESSVQVMTVSALDFNQVWPHHPLVSYVTRFYGRAYHFRLIAAKPPYCSWPNDLRVPNTEASDLMSADVGLGLLNSEISKGTLNHVSQSDLEELIDEIKAEKSAVQLSPEGDLERIVAVVAVRLQRQDNLILVEIGSQEKGERRKSNCKLPGGKRGRGELPAVAYDRIIEQSLLPFADGMEVITIEEEIVRRPSENYGIVTKYLKSVHYAKFKYDYVMPQLQTAKPPKLGSTQRTHTSSASRPSRFQPQILMSPSLREGMDELLSQEVLVVESNNKIRFMTWMQPDMFDFLSSSSEANVILQDWVTALDVGDGYRLSPKPSLREGSYMLEKQDSVRTPHTPGYTAWSRSLDLNNGSGALGTTAGESPQPDSPLLQTGFSSMSASVGVAKVFDPNTSAGALTPRALEISVVEHVAAGKDGLTAAVLVYDPGDDSATDDESSITYAAAF